MIKVMKERFGCNPDDIHVAIGPSINVCCYNVGEERAKDFELSVGESVVQRRNGVAYLDLWNATVILLKEVSIKRENIDDGERSVQVNIFLYSYIYIYIYPSNMLQYKVTYYYTF